MAAAAHNPAFAKKVGIPVSVAKEFTAADKGKRFGTGGDVNRTIGGQNQIGKQRTRFGSVLGNEKNIPNINLNKYVGKKEGGKIMATKEMHSEKSEMKQDIAQDKKLIKKAFGMHDKQEHKGSHTNLTKLKGGGMAKETMGPRTMAKDVEAGSNKLTKFGQSAVQKRGMTKGKNLGDTGPSEGIQAGGMCGGGKVKKMAKGGSASTRADGIASKGKTKGKWC